MHRARFDEMAGSELPRHHHVQGSGLDLVHERRPHGKDLAVRCHVDLQLLLGHHGHLRHADGTIVAHEEQTGPRLAHGRHASWKY